MNIALFIHTSSHPPPANGNAILSAANQTRNVAGIMDGTATAAKALVIAVAVAPAYLGAAV